jgi:hypothetical protein
VALGALKGPAKVRNERVALNVAKEALDRVLRVDDRLDPAVRRRIPPRVHPGSREWEILYRKYMEEELQKLGRR